MYIISRDILHILNGYKLVSVIDAEELQQEDTGPEFETEVGNLGLQEGGRNYRNIASVA